MPLKTPFRFINGVYYTFTRRDYNHLYTVPYLHSLHFNLFSLSAVVFAYSVSLSLKHLNSLQLFNTNEFPATVSYRELITAPIVFKITSRHALHGKRLLHYWDVLEPFPSNGRGTDLQKTSYVRAILSAYWRSDCCLATSSNIRNSIVACVYSVARCLLVRCLAIHFIIWTVAENVPLVPQYWTVECNVYGMVPMRASPLQ
jgi:hypothetical protein